MIRTEQLFSSTMTRPSKGGGCRVCELALFSAALTVAVRGVDGAVQNSTVMGITVTV